MKITIVNKEIIKKLSVHDGIMGPITYNYEEKSCTFEVMNPGWNRYQTCLLYTSPSPRDRTRARMPSSA